MPDIKQLRTFVVSADLHSFSKAAQILYTTQSSVSKTIASLEQELNTHLFRRESHGIELTKQGRVLYRYAARVLDDMEEIEHMKGLLEDNTVHICGHPSSWFARRFVEFYNMHYEENLHFEVHNATTEEILQRIASEKDEIGFLYVFRSQNEKFLYRLEQLHLEWTPLREVGPMLYLGTDHPEYGTRQMEEGNLQEIRLVQMYEDEFAHRHNWRYTLEDGSDCTFTPEVAVRTNSDYVMQAFLHGSRLANISAESHPDSEYRELNSGSEISITHYDGKAEYGYIKRAGEPLGPTAAGLLAYITAKLKEQ